MKKCAIVSQQVVIDFVLHKVTILTPSILTWRAYNSKTSLVTLNLYCYKAGISPATACPFSGYFMVMWHLTKKTVYRQMSWVGNIAKTDRLETVHCYLLNVDRCCTWLECAVQGGLMSLDSHCIFQNMLLFLLSNGLTHLFCYMTNHLMTPLGKH